MSYPPSVYKTWIAGETLTAADLNNSFSVIPNSNICEDTDDMSVSTSEMRTVADPDLDGSGAAPVALDGEIFRLRKAILDAKGSDFSYWYNLVANKSQSKADLTSVAGLLRYRKPNMLWISVTTVDIESNTGTQHETVIVFPDGNVRTVLENTGSTSKYRRFIITEAAEFTSGTENSGLRSGISEANNTWYAIYAVKSVIDSTKFVLAGDTTLPVRSNYATLNTRYGTWGWVYLGMIRNGDNSGTAADLLNFVQNTETTHFLNACVLNAGTISPGVGIRLATQGAAGTELTYTVSIGSGAAQIPDNLTSVNWLLAEDGTADQIQLANVGRTAFFLAYKNANAVSGINQFWGAASTGISIRASTAANTAKADICICGFRDTVLAKGSNPLVGHD